MTSHLFELESRVMTSTAAPRARGWRRFRARRAIALGALGLLLWLSSAATGNAAALICGANPHPHVSGKIICHTFFGITCDNKDLLQNAAWYYPGGWTCRDGLATTWGDPHVATSRTKGPQGDVRLVRDSSGRAMVVVDGNELHIASDKFMAFMDELRRETAQLRVSTAAIQERVAAFLATDDGYVSEERLQQLSLELGLPIEQVVSPGAVAAPAGRAPGR